MNQEYRPYFYIIQDTRNGMYYAGSKYSLSNTNPDTFMTEEGYKTSSNIVSTIIENYGLEVFVVRKLKIFNTKEEALHYETRFLRKVSARSNSMFYNRHNNDGYFDEISKEQIMMEIYGVDNYFKTDQFKEKHREYCLENYGVEHHLMSEEIINKRVETNLEKYGHKNVWGVPEIRKRCEKTNLERYGAEHYAQTKEFKENLKNYYLKNYGVEHYVQTQESREFSFKRQENNYNREIVTELKKLVEISRDYDINISKEFGMKHFWWQSKDETLIAMRDGLAAEIERKKYIGYKKKTKREKMQELNRRLYEREIVKEIKTIALNKKIKLGPAWWRKDDDYLKELLDSIK